MNIKEWANKKSDECLQTIKKYIQDGLSKKIAYHIVMDNSTLGAGYKAQIRHDIGLSIFD